MYIVTPHKNRLNETVLMMGHNIHIERIIWKVIPKFSLLPPLIWSSGFDFPDCSVREGKSLSYSQRNMICGHVNRLALNMQTNQVYIK